MSVSGSSSGRGILNQRDLVSIFKRETLLNLKILSKIHTMPVDLSRHVFKDNSIEKLTQPVFNHLAYYLVAIIDPQACASLPWPLYDSKTERSYRNELAVLISEYSNKGLLSPVMSSYLVNPGCYKVTYLIFQLTKLAVQRTLLAKMHKEKQKTLYSDVTMRYKSQNTHEFISYIDKISGTISSRFSHYLWKRECMEKNAEVLKKRILSMEEQVKKAQEYINELVDGFIKNKSKDLDEDYKNDLLKIKNVNEKAPFFDRWLAYVDKGLDELETEWDTRMTPFLQLCKKVQENTEILIARQTGEVDKSSYTVEFNPKIDTICTKDLEDQVNSEQKYILKNIVKDNKLNFPNLIRGFLVSISYILKNTEIADDIVVFNQCLDGGMERYEELVSALKVLIERVIQAESRLEVTTVSCNRSISMKEVTEIPPLPDLSDLKMTRVFHTPSMYDVFTPWNIRKHQFNLRSKLQTSFSKSSKTLVTPFHYVPPKHDIFSSRISMYNQMNSTLLNCSIISTTTNRGNETIAEGMRVPSSGFTKEQIQRLLSTKKSSTTKKYKFKLDRPKLNIKKGGLFNESVCSNESTVLVRSQSSPNLYENKDNKFVSKRIRKLSIMREDTPSLLEVSGIAVLEKNSGQSTPQEVSVGSCRKLIDTSSLPSISVISTTEKITRTLNDTESEFNKENINENTASFKVEDNIETQPQHKSLDRKEKGEGDVLEVEVETPKANTKPARRTSSLEKIINRFKKVRATVFPTDTVAEPKDCTPISEEKEKCSDNVEVITVNRVLLPDLLSPSCNLSNNKCSELPDLDSYEERPTKPRKLRESLGTMLGVDHTFLDQFDLVD